MWHLGDQVLLLVSQAAQTWHGMPSIWYTVKQQSSLFSVPEKWSEKVNTLCALCLPLKYGLSKKYQSSIADVGPVKRPEGLLQPFPFFSDACVGKRAWNPSQSKDVGLTSQ